MFIEIFLYVRNYLSAFVLYIKVFEVIYSFDRNVSFLVTMCKKFYTFDILPFANSERDNRNRRSDQTKIH